LALVIGNARYREIPLNNPENDARVIASTLRRLGFEVSEHVNLNVKDFRRVLREFARRLQNEAGAAVFFYAGHGVQIDGRNYLLPVDINLRDEEEVKDEAVDVDELFVSRLERSRAAVRIVILDACRDNPFKTRTRNIAVRGGGLAEMNAAGALIAYSSAPGSSAEDGPPGTNSVFTRHLAKEMLTEGVEVEQMFKNVRVNVIRDTGQRQVPWVNTSMTVNFMFNPPRGASRDDAAKQAQIAKLQELLQQREQQQRQLEEQLKQLQQKLQGTGRPAVVKPAPVLEESAEGLERPASSGLGSLSGAASVRQSTAPRPSAARNEAPATPLHEESKPALAEKPASTVGAASPRKSAASRAEAPPPATKTQSELCVALLIRAQLGEPLSQADMRYLQKECR
jgi:hypothetical protein